MTRYRTPICKLAAAMALATALVVAPQARAQDLHRLLPTDTVLALGMQDLASVAPLLDAFVEPWVELGVGEALAAAIGGVDATGLLGTVPLDADAFDEDLGLPPELVGLEPLALLGREAWLGVSMSRFNPLPAVTLLARVDGETGARFDAAFARAQAEGALSLAEGALGFVLIDIDGFVLAGARDGELLAASSNPDVLRGVLRLRQGVGEPGFGDVPGVAATLGALGAGELYGFLDLGPLARALSPLAAGVGFDTSVERLVALLETLGPVAGVTAVDAAGAITGGLRRLEPAGGDLALVRLLSSPAPAPRELLDWVPPGALSVQLSAADPGAWWGYLGELVAGMREFGVPDLNRTVADVLGVDLGRDLFGWAAPGVIVVQTGAGELAPLGAPADDLLGENVLGLRTHDEAAAEAGLARLLRELAQRVALFADPFAAPGANTQVAVRERQLDGVTLRAYDVLPGLTLSTAVTDGVAWIATSEAGLERVLLAGRLGIGLPPVLADLVTLVPDDATSLTLSDDRAALLTAGASLAQQVQLLAGFAPGPVDFDAVEEAIEAVEVYIEFVAPRFGGSASWTTLDDGRLRSEEWRLVDLR